MISLLYLILIEISVSLTQIDFDEYGNKYIRARLSSYESRTYQVSLGVDEYIYIIGSSSIHYELNHFNTNITMEYELDSRSRKYYLLQPSNRNILCGDSYNDNNCKFNLYITNSDSSTRSIWIRFNKNIVIEPKKVYSDKIKLRKRRRYGMKIENRDLPILVKLTPNQNYKKMDIDLYGYTEKQFTSYYFPNRAERNHINNYPEEFLITSVDSYFQDGIWHFFEIYGSTDSEYDEMDYVFRVIPNYAPHNLLKKVLLIFAFTIASSFIFGIILSFLCTFRHQILFCLRIRSTPHRNGASKRQIRKLKIIQYKENMKEFIDSSQCIICLEDYNENEKIRILKCNHNFHKTCSDEWLFINNKCPLCNQNIADAQNMHNNNNNDDNDDIIDNIDNKIEIEMVQYNQNIDDELQELQSDGTSVLMTDC